MRKKRVLIGKIGLDGHDVGAKVVAAALRDAGMEVIYTGLRQTPESIVNTAIQEDVDAIGISILSGSHITLISRLIDVLKKEDADDIKVLVGGVIPEEDISLLIDKGVYQVFPSESEMDDIIACFETLDNEMSERI
ncbi:cobalamin B12-binding domain-containing protein [Alkalihalobacillus sp. BA299]|uniref:cobalamin B12-binding domain-containing protein n=1 Tax=Alkalihalobacillus sp. BA299 TaxID=2815938 RepID=UPI001ADBB3BF|nr:cobalamin B12-binding domain-containing protein [Alkalihalobacillus sp. BA299]